MVEKLEESVGKSLKQNKKTILLLKKAPKPNPPPQINNNKKTTRKNQPKNPEKKRYKIYALETKVVFFTLSRTVSEKETQLVIGLVVV